MEARNYSFSRSQPCKNRSPGRLSTLSAKMRGIWMTMTLFFQLDCFRQRSEEPEEDISIYKGLSTYLTPIGRKYHQEPFREKASGAEFSRLPLSVQKQNKVLAKARLEMLEGLLRKKQSTGMDGQGKASKASSKGNCTTSGSSQLQVGYGQVPELVKSFSSQDSEQTSSKDTQSSIALKKSSASTFGGTLKQTRIGSIGSRTAPKRPEPRRKNVKGILRLKEVRAQSEKDTKRATSGEGEPAGEPTRLKGRKCGEAAYSRNASRLRLARKKVWRGIKILLLPPKQQLKFIKQKYIAGILREYWSWPCQWVSRKGLMRRRIFLFNVSYNKCIH